MENENFITNEQADKLLSSIKFFISAKQDENYKEYTEINWELNLEESKKNWQELGYIKQSREDILRNEIKLLMENPNIKWMASEMYIVKLYEELVEILDNKDKQC